ncbi:MAG TPA: ATP-binding cassette domain-containing protein [Tepidisphaeraceae bacterium]|nr:ATP-binding cassette domain-containing protein [Tepidisphaeraceae bacterium]
MTLSNGSTADPFEIRVEDVHKSFGAVAVLRGVNLDVRRGEMVAIVGESGGGKTVLLQHMIGRLHPDQGRVLVADHESQGAPLVDLSQLGPEQMDRLRRHWAVVFQKNALFTGTVYENIALGLSDVKGMVEPEIGRHVRSVVTWVGLDPDQVLTLSRDELSGGMAKRVAVARALALDPVLIFYDEPTTGLDPEHAEQIQDLIRQVHQQMPELGIARTSVIVTHDIGLLFRLRPRIVMLHAGRVHFDGAYDAFVSSTSPIIRPYLELMPVLQHRNM